MQYFAALCRIMPGIDPLKSMVTTPYSDLPRLKSGVRIPFPAPSFLWVEAEKLPVSGKSGNNLAVHVQSPTDIRHFDLGEIRGFGGADFRIAVRSHLPDRGDSIGDLSIGSSTPQQLSQVISLSGKKTGIEKTVRRQPGPSTVTAEGLGH